MKAQFVSENINFERGQDPKSALGIGEVDHIIDQWNNLQQSPGIGSLNLRILDGEVKLEIYVSYMPGSAAQGRKSVSENFNMEYFHEGRYLDGPNLYYTIKDEYADLFQEAFRKIYNIQMDESMDFERGQDPKEAMDIGNKDAQIIEKLRNLGYLFGWKEVPTNIGMDENGQVKLFQWKNNKGEPLIFYKLEFAPKTFYEMRFHHKKYGKTAHVEYFQNQELFDPDMIWMYLNR